MIRTDNQLVEFSARAMGWIDYPWDSIEQGNYWHTDPSRVPFDPRIEKGYWNPLLNSGDAFKLAVTLHMNILISAGSVQVSLKTSEGSEYTATQPITADANACVRRAIVEVAAQIWDNS